MKTKDQTLKSAISSQEVTEFCKLDRASRKALLCLAIFLLAIKNLPKIRAAHTYYGKLSNVELIPAIKGIVFTGDHDATTPPYDDTAAHGAADDLGTALANHVTDPSPANTSLVAVARVAALDIVDANIGYASTIANKVSRAKGDINAGLDVMKRLGIVVAGKGGGKRVVGVVEVGEGWVHVHEDKARKGYEGHVWEAGIPKAKGTPPDPTTTQKFYQLAADCVFTVPQGCLLLAYRHASVLPVGRKSKSSTQTSTKSAKAKAATMIPSNKAHHPVFDITAGAQLNWGEWRYVSMP